MLTDREKRMLQIYEKQLAMPSWKFILLFGIVSFGLSMAFIVTIVDALMSRQSVGDGFRNHFLLNLALAPLAGIAYGYFTRKMAARQYKKLKEKEFLP